MAKQENMELPPLTQIYFYLTEGCNLACRHCWLAPPYDDSGRKYPTLSVRSFERAVKEAKPMGLASVKLTGGEPLLHPEFPKILEIVRRENLNLTIETNGLLCDRAMAEAIARFPNRFVSVSIDGINAETHDRIRGVEGAFGKARQAVRNLVETGTPPQIIMTLMRATSGQVEAMVRMAEEWGAGSVKFNVLQPMARGEAMSGTSEALSLEEIIALGLRVDRELSRQTKLSLFFDYPMAFRPLRRIASPGGCGICGILGIIGVIPSGHYALCGVGEQIPELVFGEVGADSLADVWSGNPVLKELRAGLPDRLEGICKDCLMKHACLGSCIAQNYYRSKNLWAPYWFCDEAEKLGRFPGTRKSLADSF